MYGVGPVPALKGLQVEDSPEAGTVRRTVFRFHDFVLKMNDDAGVGGYGSQLLYTFPEALVFVKGLVADLTLDKDQVGDTNGVSDVWDGDFGVGTTATVGVTPLATTFQDLINTTATPQAVAGHTTAKAVGIAATQFDGTGGAKVAHLNVLIDDADQDITTNPCSFIVNGTIVINWEVIGDK